ncbi:hypothetical protein PR048_020233 [Dryococelus australis]|uniref:Transient receptor potential cation channel subfamily A member 1 n=1 Tax=Dryococelus australis TaxID=614101 RepID=A0ABQ9H5U8_9NEOP|nr:hypothetical protein PR048_020233 [Dryococelus australis]
MLASRNNSTHLPLQLLIDGENNPLLTPQKEDEDMEMSPLSADIDAVDIVSIKAQEDLIEAMQHDNFTHFETLLSEIDFKTLSSAPYFLASACWCDDGRYISAALQAGINPNIVIKDGIITETYQRLREHGITSHGNSSDHRRKDRKAIHIAAGSENFQVLVALLDHPETDKAAVDSFQETWLHYFARRPYVNPTDDRKPDNISHLLLQRAESIRIVNVLNKAKNSFIHLAALYYHYTLMENALRNDILGLDVSLKNNKGETALHLIARSNPEGENEKSTHMSCIKLLIKKGIDVNAKNKQKSTALHTAADSGNYLVMRALLSNENMDICSKDNDYYTAFHRLAQNNKMSDERMLWCTRMFFKLDALDVNSEGASGRTPLHLCIQSGNFIMLKELFRHREIQVAKKDHIDRTFIHYMSKARENKQLGKIEQNLKFVLDKGIDINAQDKYGQTALHIAAMENFPEMIYILLDHGADILEKNQRGKSVVDIIQPQTLEIYMNRCIRSFSMSHENNFKITFNYRFLLSNIKKPPSSSCNVESSVTFALSTNRYLQHLLCHPLITSFLHLKWHKCRSILFAHAILYFILMALVNVSIVIKTMAISANLTDTLTHNSAQNRTDGETISPLIPAIHIILPLFAFLLLGKLFTSLILFPLKYNMTIRCLLELFVCLSSFYLTFCYWVTIPINKHLALSTVILSWFQLILLTGSLPFFSVNLEMLKGVLKTFIQYFSWYFIIIIGFALSFFVLISNAKNHSSKLFLNPWSSIVQTILIMTGQGDPSQISTDHMPIVSDLLLLLFLIVIVLVLLNLLSGLAIGDTGAIRSQAQLLSQKSMVRYVHDCEAMLRDGKRFYFMNKLQHMTRVASNLENMFLFTIQPNKSLSTDSYVDELRRLCGELMKIRNSKLNANITFSPTKLNESIIETTKDVLQKEETIREKLSALDTKINDIYDILFEEKLKGLKNK